MCERATSQAAVAELLIIRTATQRLVNIRPCSIGRARQNGLRLTRQTESWLAGGLRKKSTN